jgi:anti-sigma regulatory factor (Ser/Thr protein kinase)
MAKVRSWRTGLSEEALDSFELVASELLTNALVHGGGSPVHVTVTWRRNLLRLAVADGNSVIPMARQAGPEAESGRGLMLVELMAPASGVSLTAMGKTAWASWPTP